MPIKFEVVEGETEHIAFGGKRTRKSTVLMRVYTPGGVLSLSKKAFLLGAALALCQVLDGILTYIGLRLFGVHMEGNGFLRVLMNYYGMAPALFFVKFIAIIVAGVLMYHAHSRRWIRPLLLMVIFVYLTLALVPWTILISRVHL